MLATVAGIAAEALLPGSTESYWPALLLVPLLLAVQWKGTQRCRQIVLLAVCFLVGGWWLSRHPLPEPPEVNVAPAERALVEGCIVSAPRLEPERVRFVLAVSEAEKMQVSVYSRQGEAIPALSYGMRMQVLARVRPPRNFRNPGAFDYEGYLYRQRIFWLGSASGSKSVKVLGEGCGRPLIGAFHGLRGQLLNRLEELFSGDAFTRQYLAANLFGEDAGLPEEVREDFRRAGVYHTLVISGQHVAILATTAFFLLQLTPMPRWGRYLLVALICWAYTLISGYEVPAVRAAVAVSLYLAGSLAYRRARQLNLLSAIALLFLGWDPSLLLDAGFQLSFGAVLLIAGIAAPLQQRVFAPWIAAAKRLHDTAMDLRLPMMVAAIRVELRLAARTLWLATGIPEHYAQHVVSACVWTMASMGSLVMISVVVQAGLSPLLIELFHRTPLMGPLANLVMGPLLAVLLPAGFVHTALPCAPLGWLLETLSHCARGMVHWTALTGPDPRILGAPGWVLLLCAVCIVATVVECEPMLRREPRMARPREAVAVAAAKRRRSMRMRAALAVGVSGAWAMLLLYPFAPKTAQGYLELTMLDVGQGEALLVVGPEGSTMLIDTGGLGGYSSASRLDTGEEIVAPYLWERGIRRLDLLVLSHFDFDHAGGASSILRAFRPRELWTPAPVEGHALAQEVAAVAKECGVPVVVKGAGDRVQMDGVEITVLHPGPLTFMAGGSNESSLVLQLRYGESTMLLTGDLGRREELQLLTLGDVPRADVLKVAHHGSGTSTSDAWVQRVQPSIALISAGWLNPFRHPNASVVERLERYKAAVWRTDRDGAITVRTNGQRWEQAWPGDESR